MTVKRFAQFLAALLAGAVASLASAQEMPVPQPMPIEIVANALADCGVRMPVPAFVECYAKYLDDMEAAHAAADAEFYKLAPGTEKAADPEGKGAKALSELDRRSLATSARIMGEFMDRIQAIATGQEEAVANARAVMDYFNEYAQVSGGFPTSGKMTSAPLDFSLQMGLGRGNGVDDDASRARRLKIWMANLDGRRKALSQYSAATRDVRSLGEGTSQASANQERGAFSREQIRTLAECEPLLTAFEKASLKRFWLQMQLGRGGTGFSLQSLPRAPGFNPGCPADYMAMILQIASLTDAQRDRMREVAKTWIDGDAACIRASLGVDGQAVTLEELQAQRKALQAAAMEQVLNIVEVTENANGMPQIGSVQMLPELPEADAELLGMPKRQPVVNTVDSTQGLRRAIRPVGYPSNLVSGIADDLQLNPDQVVVLEAAVADARIRWKEKVDPLVNGASAISSSGGGVTLKEMDAGTDALRNAQKNATEAFKAAFECDAELFAALDAALPAAINRDALRVVASARRTAEGVGLASQSPRETSQVPADLPRALLQARLSEEGRRKALQEIQPFLAQLELLGKQRQENQRALHVGSLLNPRVMQPDGRITKPNRNGSADTNADAKDALDVATDEKARIAAAWQATQTECTERIAGVLNEQDAAAWRASVNRVQWPRSFADVSSIRRAVDAMAVAQARAAAATALLRAEEMVNRAGERALGIRQRTEAAIQAVLAENPRTGGQPKSATAAGRPVQAQMTSQAPTRINMRSFPIEGMARSHVIVATERVRAAIPEGAAASLPECPAALMQLAGAH